MQANLKRKVFLSGCRRFVTVYDAIIGSGKGSSFHLIRTRATSCITLKSQINITKFGFGVEMVSVILLRATASQQSKALAKQFNVQPFPSEVGTRIGLPDWIAGLYRIRLDFGNPNLNLLINSQATTGRNLPKKVYINQFLLTPNQFFILHYKKNISKDIFAKNYSGFGFRRVSSFRIHANIADNL